MYLVLNLQNKTRMSTRIGCGQQQRFVEQSVCVPLCFCCQELSKMWQCRQQGGRLTHQCPHSTGLLLVTCGRGSPWLVSQLLQTISLCGENVTSSKRKKYSCFLSYPPKGDTFLNLSTYIFVVITKYYTTINAVLQMLCLLNIFFK